MDKEQGALNVPEQFENSFQMWAKHAAPGLDAEALRVVAWHFYRQGFFAASNNLEGQVHKLLYEIGKQAESVRY